MRTQEQPFAPVPRRSSQEEDAMRVLALIVRHQRPGDGLEWTCEAIAGCLPTLEPWQTEEALIWLLKQKFIERSGEQWFVTERGCLWITRQK